MSNRYERDSRELRERIRAACNPIHGLRFEREYERHVDAIVRLVETSRTRADAHRRRAS